MTPRKNMIRIIILLFLFLPSITLGQNTVSVNMSITDTVVVVKKSKNRSRYAAKVNVEISVPDFAESMFLFSFNKYVASNEFICDMNPFDNYRESSIGLQYIVEDKNNHIMKIDAITFVSYKHPVDELEIMNTRRFVSSKQKIEYRLLNDIEQSDYDRAKYKIDNGKQSLMLYPLLGSFHYYLPKGEYYLYFVYSFNNNLVHFPPATIVLDSNKPVDYKIFNGSFVSNKVKLIVK